MSSIAVQTIHGGELIMMSQNRESMWEDQIQQSVFTKTCAKNIRFNICHINRQTKAGVWAHGAVLVNAMVNHLNTILYPLPNLVGVGSMIWNIMQGC